jgi:hypothetical protein
MVVSAGSVLGAESMPVFVLPLSDTMYVPYKVHAEMARTIQCIKLSSVQQSAGAAAAWRKGTVKVRLRCLDAVLVSSSIRYNS